MAGASLGLSTTNVSAPPGLRVCTRRRRGRCCSLALGVVSGIMLRTEIIEAFACIFQAFEH